MPAYITLRHTFLTEAGQYTDPFTLQYVAGHDTIKTTMRCVHPQAEAVETLFIRLRNLENVPNRFSRQRPLVRSVQNPARWMEPSGRIVAKLLHSSHLHNAEVVELADTPS